MKVYMSCKGSGLENSLKVLMALQMILGEMNTPETVGYFYITAPGHEHHPLSAPNVKKHPPNDLMKQFLLFKTCNY